MRELDAGEFLAAIQAKRVIRKVELPEMDTFVHVAAFSLTEREWYISMVRHLQTLPPGTDEAALFPARVLVRQIVDASGKRRYDDAEAAMVGQMPTASAQLIINAILEASGLAPTSIESAEKKSESAPSSASSSPSPSGSE